MTNDIEKSIILHASVGQVWQALTDYSQFGAWFRVRLEAPFAPGAESRGHITYPGYEHVVWQARIVTMEPESLFSFSWHPYAVEEGRDYSLEPQTLVEFYLTPVAEGTELRVVESGFEALPDSRPDEARRMNDEGWSEQMRNIRSHIESR